MASLVTAAVDRVPGVAQFDAFRPSISQGDSRPRSSRTGSSFDPGSFLTLLRVVCDFPEAMWGVLQQAISTLDVDFPADAAKHFERLLSNATTPAFERALREAAGDRGTGDRGPQSGPQHRCVATVTRELSLQFASVGTWATTGSPRTATASSPAKGWGCHDVACRVLPEA